MSTISAVPPMRPVPWRVLAVRRETQDTMTPTFEGMATAALPCQFNMLYADLLSGEQLPRIC